MVQYAEEMGLVARAYKVGPDILMQIPLPSIAIVRRMHFIVLEQFESDEQLVIVDPLVGRCRIAVDRFLKVTNGGQMLLLALAKSG
jgi:ABC-type bacteriocin/lantibiotic exporter with double-glycine peptidase domain